MKALATSTPPEFLTGEDKRWSMEAEIWKPVEDYEGYYEVSSHGKVRNSRTKKNMMGSHTLDGYHYVCLRSTAGKKAHRVHRLVAMAFCSGYKPELQVNHIDCVRTNNHFSNLEWVTARENQQHACAVGNLKHKVLSLEELSEVRRLKKQDITAKHISTLYGISEGAVLAATADIRVCRQSPRTQKPVLVKARLKPPIPEETIAEMRRLRAKGDTMISIAERLGVGHTVVWRNCHDVLGKGSRAGTAGPKQTPQNVIEAMRLQRWALGDSYDNIAKAHGVSKPSAIKYCKDVQIGLGV